MFIPVFLKTKKRYILDNVINSNKTFTDKLNI